MRHLLQAISSWQSPSFRILALGALTLALNISVASPQSGGGGGGGGTSAGGGGAAAGRSGSATPVAPSMPAQPAPSAADRPTDPGRNNVDANPPTRRLEGANPGTTRAPTAGPAPRNEQPGGTQTAPQGSAAGRPGAAQSSHSDGYSECMAMWKPSNTGMSRDEWSKTCDRARLR
jgi:hypothetical protein